MATMPNIFQNRIRIEMTEPWEPEELVTWMKRLQHAYTPLVISRDMIASTLDKDLLVPIQIYPSADLDKESRHHTAMHSWSGRLRVVYLADGNSGSICREFADTRYAPRTSAWGEYRRHDPVSVIDQST
jgi:hypothetical protein